MQWAGRDRERETKKQRERERQIKRKRELTKITKMLLKASRYIMFLVFFQVSSITIQYGCVCQDSRLYSLPGRLAIRICLLGSKV